MKTCSRCGRSYPDAQLLCIPCNVPLPKGEAAQVETVAHINYLLGELPQWVMAGWMDPAQARHLGEKYERRRTEILAGGRLTPTFSSTEAPPLPPGPASVASVPSAPSPAPRPAPLAAFREDQSLAYWLAIGALLLLAGIGVLVRLTWGSSGGKGLAFALMLGLTAGLGALARSRMARAERITATVLMALAALLVPLDLYAANAFLLFGERLTPEGMGLLASLVCLPLYIWIARRRASRTFLALTALDLSAAVHFLLQAVLPSLLHTHNAWRLYGAYGPVYIVLASLYLTAAARSRSARLRPVWQGLMHTTVAAALTVSLVTGTMTTFGWAAFTLLLAGALYAAATAGRLVAPAFAHLSTLLVVGGAGLGLAAGHVPLGSRWYEYVLTALTLACLFRAFSTRLPDETARAYTRGALWVGVLAVVAQALRVVATLGLFPQFGFGGADLWGALACAGLSIALFTGIGTQALRDAMLAYGVVLADLLAAHGIPHAAPGNVGLSLALASALLWVMRRESSAQVCGWIALAVCGCYVLHGGFWGTSSLALALLTGLFARSLWADAKPGTAWLALASATLLVLLWESRGLPPLRARFGLEPNNGYGMLLLTVACLGLYARRPDSALRQAAAALGIGNAALQMVYAINGAYPFSPLWLLGAGFALTAGIAWVRGTERPAIWATTLLAYAYVTYLAGLLVGPRPIREILLAGMMLVSAGVLAALAQQQRRPFLAYAAPVACALGWAQAAHRFAHPSAVGYSLALLPLVGLLCGIAAARARRDDELWPSALQNVALAVSIIALLPCLGDFLQTTPAGDVPVVTASFLLYGCLFGGIAWSQRSAVYLYSAAALLNAAYLFGLLHHAPALTRALVALWLGLAGLAWLGAATLWKHFSTRLALTSLFPIAAGVAVVAAGLALTDMHGDTALFALLIAGTTFAGIAWAWGQSGWGHLGLWTYLLAYVAWLWSRIGLPGLANSDLFLIPIGLYVLTLGLLARRGLLDAGAAPFFLAGLLLILTPTYLAARQASGDLLHTLLLVVECLAAIFYGLTARIKAFLAAGTVFLLLWVQISLQGVSGQMSWAISTVLLGLAILGSALYLEKRRDKQGPWTQAAQREWYKWD